MYSRQRIMLYGAGSLGLMATGLMARRNLSPHLVVDANKTGELAGIPIILPSAISDEDKESALFLVCISTLSYNDIFDELRREGCRNIRHFYTWAYETMPELLENGWYKRELTEEDEAGIARVQKGLSHSALSTAHYIQFLWWRLRTREVVFDEFPVESERRMFDAPVLPALTETEVFLDGGGHLGESTQRFIKKVGNQFSGIYVFEPDKGNFSIMNNTLSALNDPRITLSSYALGSETGGVAFNEGLGYASRIDGAGLTRAHSVTLDSLAIRPTIIKLHIEGMELSALIGAKETIERCRPILIIVADHNEDGLYRIPEFILDLVDYRLFFINHDYCGNTSVFYGIPIERTQLVM